MERMHGMTQAHKLVQAGYPGGPFTLLGEEDEHIPQAIGRDWLAEFCSKHANQKLRVSGGPHNQLLKTQVKRAYVAWLQAWFTQPVIRMNPAASLCGALFLQHSSSCVDTLGRCWPAQPELIALPYFDLTPASTKTTHQHADASSNSCHCQLRQAVDGVGVDQCAAGAEGGLGCPAGHDGRLQHERGSGS
eukprot:1160090-Pelagomonas_calceolata.AAC.14